MQTINDYQVLQKMQEKVPVLILFGGPTCNVCQSLRIKLDELLPQQLPLINAAYVDCQAAPEISAQYGVFSLPVIKVYIDNQLVAERAGVFSLQQLLQDLERIYNIWQSA
ncbi:MAG TPA: thioredoxin [Oceanospirillaceae bacterium]|nr:thioredoxin [Oceanospirillaceae bacterium]